jgi:ABC-2 type transport system ATP-binding protein
LEVTPLSDPSPPAIEIQGLEAGYGRTPVLHGLSLTVRQGETVGLIGLNGAGKTTLLKSILMLTAPAAGRVHLFGEPHEAPGSRARLAYLPERFQPPGHLSGHDFVRLSLAFYRLPADHAAAAALAAALDLDPQALARPIRSYSKGMSQKLGLLATLLTGRPLLILDEPMSGLDPRARIGLKGQLARHRERGRAILMSSHELTDLDQLCDRVAVLHQGRLGYVGAPAELKHREQAPSLEIAFLAAIGDPPARAAGA